MFCFFNNIYCVYLPAHCSHRLQPLDNGPFNALKWYYIIELSKYNIITDSTPIDKVNFIRCLKAARDKAFKQSTIISAWKVTGNWPISREQALLHDEIQQDKAERKSWAVEPATPEPISDVEKTPTTSRQIKDMGVTCTPTTKYKFKKAAKALEKKDSELVQAQGEIARLTEEVERLQRSKKRKRVPNPTKRFQTVFEALAVGEEIPPNQLDSSSQESEVEEPVEEDSGVEEVEEEELAPALPPAPVTRSGRQVKRPAHLAD